MYIGIINIPTTLDFRCTDKGWEIMLHVHHNAQHHFGQSED